MAYIDEVKLQVSVAKDQLIEQYKEFVTDYIVPDLASSLTGTSVIEAKLVVSADLNFKEFTKWLQYNGFRVTPSLDGHSMTIVTT